MTIWDKASSKKGSPPVIIGTPANCPADVKFVIEIAMASQKYKPEFTAKIPKAKETDKYPKAIGIPSFIPWINLSSLLFIFF